VPSLKAIRKRITSVRSTQKITRAMKMVAGARLNRAQQRITELRPYALKTQEVLRGITTAARASADGAPEVSEGALDQSLHPLLVERAEKRVLLVVLTSDRGLCGAFNTNINKRAEREWKSRVEQGQEVRMMVIGRKGRDYMARRGAPGLEFLPGVWDNLKLETAERVGAKILEPFNRGDVDSIYLVYNEFKSAMSQQVVCERLLPVAKGEAQPQPEKNAAPDAVEFTFEPSPTALLEVLVPMYVDISVLRALYESMASELGSRMTAMDAATKNAKEMVESLTLQYNRARQAAITKELMEIIGGSEALKD
jgi:F-type H+-transporting ATPase subunit gamma